MKQGKRDALLGLVFFGALGLLLFATAVLGDWSLRPRQQIEVVFKDAQSLKLGDPVLVLGVRCGFVADITFLQDNVEERVLVKLELTKPIEVREDIEVRIQESSLLGGRIVYIDPGRGRPRTAQGPIKGISKPSPLESLGELLGEQETKGSFKKIVTGLASLVEKVDTGKGSLGALWNERGLYDSILGAVEEIRALVGGVRRGEGSAGKLFTDDRLYESAASTFASADQILAGVNRGEGVLGMLAKDQTVANNLAAIVADLRTDLREGKGLFGKLLRDERWANQFDRVLGNLATVTDKIASGEGTIGRLAMDDTLIRKLERLVGQFQRTLEDAREAAPIGTFFQVFGAFYP